MNFFRHQEQARGASRRMLVLFALSVVLVVAAVDGVVMIALLGDVSSASTEKILTVLVTASLVTLAVIGAASLYKTATLRGGGAAVARGLGATQVSSQTTNFAHRRLRNVVEEIAIASGVPVPEIYVLEREEGINAFAAGYTPSDAAVAVTQGALDKLTRDELQGVIAHEFSHVLNGDMRLNIRLMGIVFGILVLAIAGRKIAENTRGSRSSGGLVFFGIALIAIGSVGMWCGRLIKASVSRNREYLADASAVQFTRQTDGIAGALKKIGALSAGSKLARAETEEVAHMLFGDGVGYGLLMATHPPLAARILRLDPRFDPQELAAISAAWTEPVHGYQTDDPDASISGFLPKGGAQRRRETPSTPPPLPHATAPLNVSAAAVADQVGHPAADDYRVAGAIQAAIPDELRDAAADPSAVEALMFALALAADPASRERQFDLVERGRDAAVRARVAAFAQAMHLLHPMQRLPLASLAFPALRRKPRPQLQQFLVLLNGLHDVDGRIGIDEYCLGKLISVQVVESLDPSRARANGSLRLPQCRDAVIDVCALVAQYGHADAAAAQRAFLLGLAEVLPGEPAAYRPPAEGPAALDRALATLDRLQPAGKELLVRGLTRAISEDDSVTVTEAELLRTICASLHCPLPALVGQG